MSLEVKTLPGRVSHTNQQQVTYGHMHNGHGRIQTRQWFEFRVNGRPTKMNGTPVVADGDLVTVVGLDKGGEFAGYAVRNHTTNVDYSCPASLLSRCAVILLLIPFIVAGSCASNFGITAGLLNLVLLSPSLYFGLKSRRYAIAFKQANAMLPTLPVPVVLPSITVN